MEKLPIYKLVFDPETETDGIDAIALVDYPATEVNWLKFDAKKPMKFAANEDKRLLTGPIMVADTPIYRYNQTLGEFYVVFEKETIEEMMKKFFKDGKIASINEMHDSTKPVSDVYLVESWLVNGDNKAEQMGFDVTEGTWMATFYVADEEYWNTKIKTEEFKGFSLEGYFDLSFSNDPTEEELIAQLEQIANDETLTEEEIINKIGSVLDQK